MDQVVHASLASLLKARLRVGHDKIGHARDYKPSSQIRRVKRLQAIDNGLHLLVGVATRKCFGGQSVSEQAGNLFPALIICLLRARKRIWLAFTTR